MKEVSKQHIEDRFGKVGFFQGTGKEALIAKVEYLTGIRPFDERLGAKGFNKKVNFIIFEKRPKGFEIRLSIGFSNHSVGFDFSHINYFVIESQQHVYEYKSKSIVGRAIIGGLLLGPAGAIVGGLTGIRDKKVQTDALPDNLLTISITDDDNQSSLMIFSIQNKHLKETETYIRLHFPELLRSATEIVQIKETDVSSVADELSKLKILLDQGVLTQEEFNLQKAKVLGS